MTALSVLDLVTVRDGADVAEALADSTALAQAAEAAGCKRFWVAEHHGHAGIAGGATSVVLAHIAAATRSIRVGAGGIMLPNHNPFVIAEQFGTLCALHPERIDLGLGRAPGAAPAFAQALGKDLHAAAENFPRDVVTLQRYLAGDAALGVMPTPGAGADAEMWLLGSSLFGARLAAMLGLPYAFAAHFAPAMLDDALALYRREFTPSPALDRPYVMVAFNLFAADTSDEAHYVASSQQQAFVALREGRPGKLPPPVEDYRAQLGPAARAMLASLEATSAIGTADDVRASIGSLVKRTRADELIAGGATFDPAARRRSLALAADTMAELAPA